MKRIFVVVIVLSFMLMNMLFWSTIICAEFYEGYYTYLTDYPSDREYFISHECQGVTHDADNWFFSTRWNLYKIPVTVDLNNNNTAVAISKRVENLPGNHDHLGDPDYWNYNGQGYVFVPIEGGVATIGVFDASDLSFLSQDEVNEKQNNHAPWVAVYPGPDENFIYLFSSDFDNIETLQVYRVDLAHLYMFRQLVLDYVGDLSLSVVGDIGGIQGGEFTPSGDLLYLSSDNGILVFSVVFDGQNGTGTIIRFSSKSEMPFQFHWNSGALTQHEPEGLTIWDLDDGPAPHIEGQLHIILLNNDFPDNDNIYFKHYTRRIYVDADSADEYYGRPDQPFNTVSEAINQAWDGQEIVIRSGSYPESLTITKKLLLKSQYGDAVIGNE